MCRIASVRAPRISRAVWSGGRGQRDRVAVGQHLVVGDQHEDLRAQVLQPDPVPQRAEVVPQMQLPGRPVAGQDPESRRTGLDQLFQLGRTLSGDHRARPLH
jgi:hypothetical protein